MDLPRMVDHHSEAVLHNAAAVGFQADSIDWLGIEPFSIHSIIAILVVSISIILLFLILYD
jgi:hypothetical protein